LNPESVGPDTPLWLVLTLGAREEAADDLEEARAYLKDTAKDNWRSF
jgi:hypothetical protein